MKKLLHYLAAALIVAVMSAVCAISASAAEVSDFTYNIGQIDYGTYKSEYTCLTIKSYSGSDSTLVFSDELFPMSEYNYDKIRIEQNAIANRDKLETIIFPANTERILYGGIVGCDALKNVVFLGNDTIIDDINEAYNGTGNGRKLTIYGAKGSTAEKFANSTGATFVELKGTCQLKATALSNGTKLDWSDIGADSCTLYAIAADGTASEIYSGTALTYTYTPAKSGVYGYYVTADIGAIQLKSDIVYQRAGNVATLTKPAVTKKISAYTVKLSWKKVSGATEYEIYYAKKSDKKFKLLDTTANPNYSYTADAKGTYYFKVMAKAEAHGIVYAQSAKSAQINASLKPKTLAAPTVSRKVFGNVSVRLSWKKISGATEYEIYFAKKGDKKFTLLTTTTATEYTYTANAKNTYYFKVAAKGYTKSGALTGSSAKSKQITAKLTGSRFRIEDTGYYRDVRPTDPEYEYGILRVFDNGSHKVGKDIPEGWYVVYPTDASKRISAITAQNAGVAADYAKYKVYVSSDSGKPMMIYAPKGCYLTLQNCSAVLYNDRVKLPDGKDASIIWAGNNFDKGRYTLKYNGTQSATNDNITYYDAMDCMILDAETGALIKEYFADEKSNKKPVITLEDGQILLLCHGAELA